MFSSYVKLITTVEVLAGNHIRDSCGFGSDTKHHHNVSEQKRRRTNFLWLAKKTSPWSIKELSYEDSKIYLGCILILEVLLSVVVAGDLLAL
jgi:hypothetical protein